MFFEKLTFCLLKNETFSKQSLNKRICSIFLSDGLQDPLIMQRPPRLRILGSPYSVADVLFAIIYYQMFQ